MDKGRQASRTWWLKHKLPCFMLLLPPCSSQRGQLASQGRRLLQSGAATSAGDQLTQWQGYQLSEAATERNWAVDETDAPEQARYVGAAAGHNRLVAGLLLHATRKTRSCHAGALVPKRICSVAVVLVAPSCLTEPWSHAAGGGFQLSYDPFCQKSAMPLVRDANAAKAYLASLFAGDDNEVYPYGVDPAFLPSSAALYKPELQEEQGRYYNTSDPMQLAPTSNAPFGFYHRHLQVSCGCTPKAYVCVCALCAPWHCLKFQCCQC